MKKSFICLLVLLSGLSCQEDNNLFDDLTERGGFVAFRETPNTAFNLLDLDAFGIDAELIDVNNNATSYNLTAEYEGVEVTDFRVFTSFPANLVITLQDLLTAFNLTQDQLTVASLFEFKATVTTPGGVFSPDAPDFNDETNEEEGGNTTGFLLGSGHRNALLFTISFFTPPPKKIRGTSFEEPFAAPGPGDDYIRPDSEGNDDNGFLMNSDVKPISSSTPVPTATCMT